MLSCTLSMFWTTSQTSSEEEWMNRDTVKPTVTFGSRAGFKKGTLLLPCFHKNKSRDHLLGCGWLGGSLFCSARTKQLLTTRLKRVQPLRVSHMGSVRILWVLGWTKSSSHPHVQMDLHLQELSAQAVGSTFFREGRGADLGGTSSGDGRQSGALPA